MSGGHHPEETDEYIVHPKPQARPHRADEVSRPKMGFVAGTRPQFSDETACLLRNRMEAATLILSILLAVAFVANLFSEYAPLFGIRAVILVFSVGCHFVLRGPRELTLYQLRWLEGVTFGAIVLQLMLMMGDRLAALAQAGDAVSFASTKYIYLSIWAVLILTYGLLMPNTWRRALAIMLPTACLPYALILWLRWQFPAVAVVMEADKVAGTVPIPLAAVVIAVFGTHVITAIRREAFKARQLGQYVLKNKLGAGGMGEVYQAEHQLLKRPCAVKLIKPGRKADAETLTRFEREVQATARLTHWNTVEVYDYGRAEDGTFYYVMELLPGMSLEDLVKYHGPLPPERAVHFLRQVCAALREAHAKDLIHRDLKPANVIAAERGGVYDVAKLLDFGLVREQGGGTFEPGLTQPGSFSGSPLYMCPEQKDAYDLLDARSDIYSLGAVAYYLLTGRPPFTGDTIWEIIAAHARDPAKPLAEVNPAVPGDLDAVVLRCLAKLPGDRYQDAESLGNALAQCACAGKWTEQQAADWWRQVDK